MSIRIDHARATAILFDTAHKARSPLSGLAASWEPRLRELSRLCPPGKSATVHAALATATLAKCVDNRVDVYSLLDRGNSKYSYSARSLADNVLARHRSDLDLDLGANGPNPLNNTPFIGKTSIRDISGVRNRKGWQYFLDLLDRLQGLSADQAREVLQAFVVVRRRSLLDPVDLDAGAGEHLSPQMLAAVLSAWVAVESEEGRRAQACAAGVIDCIFDPKVVDVGRVNDPDRRAPLDIAVRDGVGGYPLAYEVKDKKVAPNYVQMSVEKAKRKFGVSNVVFIAVGPQQPWLDEERLGMWARERGVNLALLLAWEPLIIGASAFFEQHRNYAGAVCERIVARCRDVGVSGDGTTTLCEMVAE